MFPSLGLLTAADRQRMANLQLYARQVVEGLTVGMHHSPQKGFSIEFKEHRPYVTGDEIRTIDWKVFGKTDRLYIRQYEEETNLRCTIVVDQSGSMGYAGSRAREGSKHQFAVRLAACLTYMLLGQQDAVGLITFDTAIRRTIPVRSRPSHLKAILSVLASSQPGHETQLSAVLMDLVPKVKRRGLLVLISDCFDDADATLRALAHFRHAKNEVVVFQVWDPDELDFPFRGRTQFRSLENRAHARLVDTNLLRQAYQENLQRFRQQLSDGCRQHRIGLVHCTTDQSPAALLASYLAARERGIA